MAKHLLAFGQFMRVYWFWVAILVVSNAAAWAGVEGAWRIWPPNDYWSTRMYLASGLLLLDNLCVLWWYAHLTREQKEAAQQQLQLAAKDYIERNKPVVYSDRWEDPERAGNYHYVIRNVGGGFAVNVYFIDEKVGRFPIGLGSLAAGAERRFPATLNTELCDARQGVAHLLIAEGKFTRTTQWTPTLNFRTSEDDHRRGQVEHSHGEPHVRAPRGENQSLAEYMLNNELSLREQLQRLKEESDTVAESLKGRYAYLANLRAERN